MDGISLLINVVGGKCQWTDRDVQTLSDYVGRFDGRQVRIMARPPHRTRSVRQNAYYWGVVLTTIGNECGHTSEEVHEFCKQKFLPRAFIMIANEEREVFKSTTDLTAQEFELYLERVRAWAAQELRLNIPLPNET